MNYAFIKNYLKNMARDIVTVLAYNSNVETFLKLSDYMMAICVLTN